MSAPVPTPPVDKPPDAELFGVWVLLAVLVFPSAASGLAGELYPYVGWVYLNTLASLITRLGELALLGFIVWKSGIPTADFGLTRPKWVTDVAAGALLTAVGWVCYRFAMKLAGDVEEGTLGFGESNPYLRPVGALSWAATILRVAVGAFTEELIFRGYLVPRLERMLTSKVWAVAVGAMAFGVGQLYQGKSVFLSATLFGVVAGTAFLAARRIWPVVIAHALVNLRIAALAANQELADVGGLRADPINPANW